MNRTGIEWADWTWNPITGCLHGCSYCYARKMAETRLRGKHGYSTTDPFGPAFHPSRLDEPRKTRRPGLIFVVSMGDALGAWVPTDWIQAVIDACQAAPQHQFLWLTKNPKRYYGFNWPAHCWRGTSVTGGFDAASQERMEAMRGLGRRTFLSVEPFVLEDAAHVDIGLQRFPWVIVGAQTSPGQAIVCSRGKGGGCRHVTIYAGPVECAGRRAFAWNLEP